MGKRAEERKMKTMRLKEKTTAVLLIAIFMISTLGMAMPVSAGLVIDGVISAGEWDGYLWFNETLENTFTNPADMAVKIYLRNDRKTLYVALDIPDTYDMRAHPEAKEGGSDTFGLNIGVEGEARSYSRILQFNTADRTGDPDWYSLDGYFAQWAEATSEVNTSPWGPDMAFLPIPVGVQSATVFDATHRVQEIAIPLANLGISPGDKIRIGGCIRAAEFEGYNFHALYPVGLVWGDGSTYEDYTLWAPTPPRIRGGPTYFDGVSNNLCNVPHKLIVVDLRPAPHDDGYYNLTVMIVGEDYAIVYTRTFYVRPYARTLCLYLHESVFPDHYTVFVFGPTGPLPYVVASRAGIERSSR